MDKNTIIAIVLSTLVLIGSYLLLPKFFPNLFPSNQGFDQGAQVTEVEETTESEITDLNVSELAASDYEEKAEVAVAEKNITVSTGKAEIVLTNKGGDIISYKLVDHYDMDTGTGVQLSDNVSEFNRTCALAIGSVNSRIINDVFNVEEKTENGDKVILFTKNMIIDGQKYILGKKYTFKENEYLFKLDVLIHNEKGQGINKNGIAYTIRTSPQIGPHFDSKQNRYEYRQFVTYNGNKSKRTNFSANTFKAFDKDFIWNGIAGKYFVELMIPTDPAIINAGYYSGKVEVNNYANAQAFIERKAYNGGDIQDTYFMYFGPRNDSELKRYNMVETNGWGFGGKKLTEALQTNGFLKPFEVVLKFILELLYKIIPNWGITIIVMTLLLKIVMFPLSKKQSMGTLKMQELQPRLKAIQKKYEKDQARLQQETQKLYQEAGYNPASGCVPMILQFVIIFAMYNLFNNYFQFRGAMFIPKWIPDLSVGDSVYTLKVNIPLIGNQIRILPVIYVVSQILSAKITQTATPDGQSAAMMKFMMYGMPAMFFFMFYNAPAGLLLYWLMSNILQTGQQLVINKMMAKKKNEMAVKGPAANQKKLPPKAKK